MFCESDYPVDLHNRNATATCLISFNGSQSVKLINNRTGDIGGAIFSHVDILIDGEILSVLFDGNYVSIGAVIPCSYSYITFNQSRLVNFTLH